MGSELERVREQLEELGGRLREVEQRLARLESRERGFVAVARPAEAVSDRGPPSSAPSVESALSSSTATWIGRTLVVLGGAYVFRAATERGLVPPSLGASGALLYAAFWAWRCDRNAAAGRRTSALFHGLAATAIAYPLIWETTAVFGLVGPGLAALALVGTFAVLLGVATRHGLSVLVWAAAGAHLAAALALILGTRAYLPLSLALLAAGAAVEASPVAERWPSVRWLLALGADAGFTALVGASLLRAVGGDAPLAAPVVPALLVLPLVYLGSVAERTLRRGRDVGAFEVVQLAVALAVGLGGAARLQAVRGGSVAAIGGLALLLGVATYASAFAVVARRTGRGSTFQVFGTFALLLVIGGSGLALGPGNAALAGLWGLLSLAVLGLGVRFDVLSLRFHGVVYAGAAALASGLVFAGLDALVAPPEAWRPLGAHAVGAAVIAALGAALLFATRHADAPAVAQLPQAALAALLVLLVAGLAARALAAVTLPRVAEADAPALLAALRSVLVAILALGVALFGRWRSLPELHGLVYALLGLGAVKLVVEDLRVGDPVALFVALVAYGGALVGASRLLRGAADAPSP